MLLNVHEIENVHNVECLPLLTSIFKTFPLSLKERKRSDRSSNPEVFLEKGVLKICRKKICNFTEHSCRSVISEKLLCNFIEITLRHECSSVILIYIFRTPFYKNIYRGLFLRILLALILGGGRV